MSFSITASIADNVAYNWQARWEFVVDGITYYKTSLFDIVNQILENPVVDSDIIEAAPFVKEKNYSVVFTADSGSATTIVNTELQESDDYWNGGTAEIIDGTNASEKRKVLDFDNSTNKLTTQEFSSAIDNTSKVTLIRTFKKEIDRAFDLFILDLKNRGIFADRIIDNQQIKEYVIKKTIQLICENFTNDIVDVWFAKAELYKKEYNNLITVAVFDYDSDDDGNIEDDESKNSLLQSKGTR